MQQTTNYNLLIPEGNDIVNPLTQVNPNFQTIDGAMFANKQASIGTASEVVTGSVHAIIRNNPDSNVFRFTATGAWTAGDTMTLDGQQVTVHLSDGTTPATNSYIIGAEVLAMVNGSLVTLAISTTPPAQGVTSFNSRTGAVVPAASDYDGSMIDYDNTASGLNATDVQSAIDETVSMIPATPTITTLQFIRTEAINTSSGAVYRSGNIELDTGIDLTGKKFFITLVADAWVGSISSVTGTKINLFAFKNASSASESLTFNVMII